MYNHAVNSVDVHVSYVTSGVFKKWVSKEACMAGTVQPFESTPVRVTSNIAPTETAYKILYDKVKEGLINFVDDI